jgi:farnesyl-diphosphate farnesyltransferase
MGSEVVRAQEATREAVFEPSDAAAGRSNLEGVSRTFALTIPALPEDLRDVVTNGYLLCRIADTIEDDPCLPVDRKKRLHLEFHEAVIGERDPVPLAAVLARDLSERPLPAERELIRDMPHVIRTTRGFSERQVAALSRCVRVMCEGMSRYQRGREGRGLRDIEELHAYCYHVAGVVGEMLTDLFCEHSPEIAARRSDLLSRAVSFGQGLQMTNILKDIWEDLDRGFCWLPRDVFLRAGFDLRDLVSGRRPESEGFRCALGEMIALAHAHLRDALEYSLFIPARKRGIRRFCLSALFMALLTLRKIARRRGFASSREVKISRRSVRASIVAGNLFAGNDAALRALFAFGSTGLPKSESFEKASGWTRERLRGGISS